MPEDEDQSKLKQLWPFGAAVAFLVFEFPPPPVILFEASKVMFKGLGAAGLLIGLVFGLFTRKAGYFRPKKRAIIALGALAVLFLAFTLRYFHVLEDAENHYYETVIYFFVINILIGLLLFLVGPAMRIALDAFGHEE